MSIFRKIASLFIKKRSEDFNGVKTVFVEGEKDAISTTIKPASYKNADAEKLADEMQKRLNEKRSLPLSPDEQKFRDELTKKRLCRHMKGGATSGRFWDKYHGNRRGSKDYNISDHTFIDGSRVIKCLSCGKKWTPKSKNWKKALEMTKTTTNGKTSSEVIILELKKDDQIIGREYGSTKSVEKIKRKYPNIIWEKITR